MRIAASDSERRTWADGSPRPLLSREIEGDTPDGAGWYVETWGAGRYGSVAFAGKRADADAEVRRMVERGAWHGMRPRVTSAARIEP